MAGFEVLYTKAKALNEMTYFDYFNRIKALAVTCFEWKNLPPSIPAKFLETILFEQGRILFFQDPTKGLMIAGCTDTGIMNFYNIPVSYRAIGTGYSEEYKAEDCVLILNNYGSLPTQDSVILFAYRLADCERSIDVNVKAQKTPVIILCDEKQRTTMKTVYNQWTGNEPIILGDKNLNVDQIKTLDTKAPFVTDKLTIYKHDIWNECMTFLGIGNANTDKRERLITDEVTANNDLVDLSAQSRLVSRQEAVKLINEKYGLEISVELKIKVQPKIEKKQDPTTEVKDNG